MVLPVQNPESPYVTLKIDQGEGFSFALDKVDEFQSDIKLMNAWGEDAGKQMAQVLDRNVLTSIVQAGAVGGSTTKATSVVGYANVNSGISLSYSSGGLVAGGTTVRGTTIAAGTTTAGLALADAAYSATTGDLITAKILNMGRLLDENNAPQDGRFVIVPFWVMQILKGMKDNNFGLAYATGQNSANMMTGTVPKIDRFEIIGSNNLPLTTQGSDATGIIFGCKYGTTFATQITESRIIDNPFAFGKMMQGLQVYGFGIIKPQVVGVDFWKNA